MDNFQVAMSGDLNWVEGDKGKFFPLSKYFMLAIDDKQHVRRATHCADAAAARCPHAACRAGYHIMMLPQVWQPCQQDAVHKVEPYLEADGATPGHGPRLLALGAALCDLHARFFDEYVVVARA